jgi:N-acetylmuramoyl-L-alanine amidase
MRVRALLIAIAVTVTALVAPAAAQSAVRVVVNGSPLSLVAPPIMRGGQVMIPATRAFESFGAGAAWLPSERAVLISNRTGLVIRLTINQLRAQVNGDMRPVPVAPALIGEVAYVPAQFVFSTLGAWVRYDEAARTLHVASQIAGLRLQRGGASVRLLVDATGPLQPELRTLTNPDRLVVDLHGGAFRPADKDLPVGYAGVTRIRAGQFQVKPYITRLVFDLDQPVDARVTTAPTSFAMTVEVSPKGIAASAQPASPPPAPAAPAVTPPGPAPAPVRPDPAPAPYPLEDGRDPQTVTAPAPAAPEPPVDDGTLRITQVRIEQLTGRFRVVIEGNHAFEYTVRELIEPDRLVIDIPGAVFVPVKQEIPVAGAVITEIRAAQFQADPNVTRIVVVLRRKTVYSVAPITDGSGAVAVEVPEPGLRAHVVAIDAGHGGRDMGATGPSGLLEKDVVLDIAMRAREQLVRSGVRVIMTRETDEYVELADRPRLAKQQGATVYVSIHANASTRAAASGSETYFLSPQSLTLAQMVQEELSRITGLPNRGVKTANFLVLRESDVPAILVEVAYVSNLDDENRLRTAAFRQRLADAVVRGVQRFLAVYPVPAN